MMNKERIHELREMAVSQGLFIEGVCDEGIRVTFFEPIYVNEIFLIKEDIKFCPICGHLLLEFEEPFKHQYDYTHVCANINCSYNGAKEDIIEFYSCDKNCCGYICYQAEAESTLGVEYSFIDKVKDFFVKALDNLKDWAAK